MPDPTKDKEKELSYTSEDISRLKSVSIVKPELAASMKADESKYDIGFKVPEDYNKQQESLNEYRAQRQPALSKIGAGIANAVTQTGLDIVKDASYLFDSENYTNFTKASQEGFNNWLATSMQSVEDKLKIPVYRTKASEGFSPTSAGWWGENLPSIASTLSMIVPAEGTVMGLSKIGKLLGGEKLIQGIEAASGVTGLSDKLKGVGGAIISRQMENLMEGGQTYQDTYTTALDKGMDPEQAKIVAGEAASNNYKLNWVNLVTDIPQYMLLHKSFRQSIKEQQTGFKDIVKTIGQESAEEAYQYITNEETKRAALIKSGILHDDKSDLDDRLKEYSKDGNLWTSAFLGGLGGGIFGGIATYKNNRNLPKLQEQYEALAKLHTSVIKGDEESFNRTSDDIFTNELVSNIKEETLDNFKKNLENTISIPEDTEDRINTQKSISNRKEIIKYSEDLMTNLNSDLEKSPELKALELTKSIEQKVTSKRLQDINTKLYSLQAEDIASLNLTDPTLYQFKLSKLRYEAIKDNPLFEKEAKDLSNSINESYKLLNSEGLSKEDIDKQLVSPNDSQLINLLQNKELDNKRLSITRDILYKLSTKEGREAYQDIINKHKEEKVKQEEIPIEEDLSDQYIPEDEEQTIPKNPEDKMHIILHGDTEDNKKDIVRDKNSKLTEEGLKEAEENKQRLTNEGGVQTLISSPLDRTLQTSSIITNGQPHQINNDLRAWDRGDFEGKPESTFNEKEWVENSNKVIPGGESFNQFKKRIIDAFKDIATNANGNTAIVTHSGVESLIKAWQAAGSNGYNIDNNTFINYKEDRTKPTTLTRKDILNNHTTNEEINIVPTDTQELVSKGLNNNTFTGKDKTELEEINDDSTFNNRANTVMMRIYDHIFTKDPITEDRIFTWSRTSTGLVKENSNSKVSKEVNNPNKFNKGTNISYRLIELNPTDKLAAEEDIKESISDIKHHINQGNKFNYSTEDNFGFDNKVIGIYNEQGELGGYYPVPKAISKVFNTKDISKAIQDREAIIKERKAILSKLEKGEEVTTTIQDKGKGNLLTKLTPEGRIDVKDINGEYKTIFNNILLREQDKINNKPIFIYNDGTSLKLPDIGDPDAQKLIEDELVSLGNFGNSGQSFMLIKSANGTWYPAPIYPTTINDITIDKIISTLKSLNPSSDALTIIRSLNPYIFASTEGGNLEIKNPKGGISQMIINGENFTLNDLNSTRVEEFKKQLKTKWQNIDISNINSLSYQKQLKERGTLTTNIYTDNGEYMVQPYIGLKSIQEAKPTFEQSEERAGELTIPENITLTEAEEIDILNKALTSDEEDEIAFKKGISNNTILNRKELTIWLSKHLPQLTLSNITDLTKVKGTTPDTLGMYRNMIIHLFNGADNKVLYHEAFHGVFRGLLTNEERGEILKEARVKFDRELTLQEYYKQNRRKYPEDHEGFDPNDLYDADQKSDKKFITEIEEQLADEFAEYTQGYNNKSLGRKILDFFKKIGEMFNIFTKHPQSKIDSLYDRILSKDFAKKYIKGIENRELSPYWDTTAYKIAGVSSTVKQYHVKNISNEFIKSYFSEISKGIEVGKIDINSIFESIYNKYATLRTTISKDVKSYDKKTISGTLSVLNSFYLFKLDAIKYLGEQGIKINKDKLEFTEANINPEEQVNGEGDIDNTTLVGQTTKGFGEMSSIPGMKSASTRIKLFLSGIEILNEDDTPKVDEFGFTQFHDFKKLYYFIERGLIDINTFEDQLKELSKLATFRPEIGQVVTKLKTSIQDPINLKTLQNDFRSNFSKQQLVFTLTKFDTDSKTGKIKYEIFDANRQSIKRVVQSQWLENLSDSSKNTIAEHTQGIITTRGTSKAVKLAQYWNSIKDKSLEFKSINETLKRLGIEFDEEILKQVISKDSTTLKTNLDTIIKWYSDTSIKKEEAFRKAFEKLVDLQSSGILADYSSSFNNVENKTVYTIQLPSFASRLLKGLTSSNEGEFYSKFNELMQDPTYKNLNILQELDKDASFRKQFKLSYIDGLKDSRGDSKGGKFTKLSPKDFMSMQLAMYTNLAANNAQETGETTNIKKDTTHKYIYLTPSDKSMGMLFDSKKYGVNLVENKVDRSSDIVNKYYNLYLLEVDRIKNLLEHKDIPQDQLLQYYHYMSKPSILDGQAYNFNYIPSINSIKPKLMKILESNGDINSIKDEVLDIITKELNKEVKDVVNEALNKKIIKKEKGGLYSSISIELPTSINSIETEDKYIRQILSEYALNHRLVNTELSHLLNGDYTFYAFKKGVHDLAKRTYQSGSGSITINNLDKPTISAVAIDDYEIPTNPEVISKIEKELIKQSLSKETIDNILSAYKKSNNVTDAQVWMTPEAFKAIFVARGTWTPEMEVAHRIAEKLDKPEKLDFKYNQVLEAIKPFYFGSNFNKQLGIHTYTQVKCSIMPLYKVYTDLNPLLADHRAKLELSNTDMIATKSSLKAVLGLRDSFGTTKGDYNNKLVLDINNFGVQVDNPNHLFDEENSSLRQLKMQLLGSIDPNIKYNSKLGSTIIEEINNLESENLIEDLNKLSKEIKSKDLDFQKSMQERLTSRGATENIEESLSIINGEWKYPLDMGINSTPTENLLSSIYTNDVIKQHFTGGSGVQASALGFKYKNLLEQQKEVSSDKELNKLQSDLQWGLIDGKFMAEAAMPAWSKEFFGEDGYLKSENDIPDELRQLLVYRIPTEGYHSMLSVKVVKFLPETLGNFILLPYEITTQFGADFDFDKVYFLSYDFHKDKESGLLKKVNDLKTKEGRNNAILDNYHSVIQSPNTLRHSVKPSGFDELVEFKNEVEKEAPKRNFFSSRTQRELKQRNHVGKDLKGIFAQQVSAHAYGILLGLNTESYNEKTDEINQEYGFHFNGESNYSLSKLTNTEGNLIGDEVSMMMAAVLDDIKNPIIETLGINIITANVWSTIVRSGAGYKTATNLTTQPSIKELSNKLLENFSQIKGTDFKWNNIDNIITAYGNRFDSVYELLSPENKDSLSDLIKTKNDLDLTNEDMKSFRDWANQEKGTKVIEGDEEHNLEYAKYLIFQQKVLNNYKRYDNISKELNKVNRFFAINKEVGPNIENIIDKKALFEEITNPNFMIQGVSSMQHQLPQLDAYYNIHLKALETLSKEFPYASTMYTDIKSKVAISQTKSSGQPILNLIAEKRMKINGFIRMFLDNKYFFSNLNNSEEKERLLKEFPNEIKKILDPSNDNEYFNGALRESALFQNLQVWKDKKDEFPIIRLKSSKIDTSVKDNITNSIQNIYNNEKTKKIVVNLINYSYIASGFYSGFNSFHSLIPVEVLGDTGYAEHRKALNTQLFKGKYLLNSIEIKFLKNQLIRNYPQDFTKVFDSSLFIKDKEDKLRINEVELSTRKDIIIGIDEEGKDIYMDYIRVYDEKAKNTMIYEQRISGVYSPISKLGNKGKFIEINSEANIKQSLITFNNQGIQVEYEESNTDLEEPTMESNEYQEEEYIPESNDELFNQLTKDITKEDIDNLPSDITPC